jgi:hypothetical protein
MAETVDPKLVNVDTANTAVPAEEIMDELRIEQEKQKAEARNRYVVAVKL